MANAAVVGYGYAGRAFHSYLIVCVDFCKALADETRQAILQLLVEGEK